MDTKSLPLDDIEATVMYLLEVQQTCTREEVTDAIRADDPEVWSNLKDTISIVRNVIASMRDRGQIELANKNGSGIRRYQLARPAQELN